MSEHSCDPLDEDKNGENCLTLAIKNRKRDMALWLLKIDRFRLEQTISKRGFNYFSYALVKGQQVVTRKILQRIEAKGMDS